MLSDLKSKCTFNHNTMSKEKSKPRLLERRKHTRRQCQTCSWASLLPCRQGRLGLIPVPRACDGAGHATPRRGLGAALCPERPAGSSPVPREMSQLWAGATRTEIKSTQLWAMSTQLPSESWTRRDMSLVTTVHVKLTFRKSNPCISPTLLSKVTRNLLRHLFFHLSAP